MNETLPLTRTENVHATSLKPARVLIITPVGLQGRGGIDRLNLYLFDDLTRRGAAEGLTFIASRGEWRGPFWLITFLIALLRFAGACLSRRYDVAHIHVSTNGSALRKMFFGLVARVLNMPYVIHYHGMMSADIERQRQSWLRALGVLARGASRVIVLGAVFCPPFARMGVDPARVVVVRNGIPDIGAAGRSPRPVDGRLRILFSGEVGERKGADLLVAAVIQLADVRERWTCTIAGNGEIGPLRDALRAAGLDGQVDFTGWIAIDRVHRMMRAADVVVLPSRAEALPLALIEGASAGAALIATDVGAVREVVRDGENGFIVDRDADAVAAALRRLIEDEARLRSMQAASRRIYCENFQISTFVRAICNAHEAACARSPAPAR